MSGDPYLQIANHLPHVVELGGALIVMVEPEQGFEEPHNRWYEDDHFYAGAMVGPWVFAGRRYVATRQLRARREPTGARGRRATSRGSYIALYWHLAGHIADVKRWALEALTAQLIPAGRGPVHRRHVYTAFHEFAFGHVFDPPPMKVVHALDHPYAGLAVEVIDVASTARRADLLSWLKEEFVPQKANGGFAGQCLAFTPIPFGQGLDEEMGWKDNDPAQRVCVLWFLKDSPLERWPDHFAGHENEIAASGLGELALLAPFIPTRPGTAADLG